MAGDRLDIDVRQHRIGFPVVSLAGPVDISTCEGLREVLLKLIEGGNVHLVLDMERVPYVDSAGLGVLVAARRSVGPCGGSVRIAKPSTMVQRVLEITRLTDVFGIYPDVESALGGGEAAP
ncbi:MAG: STAS domain-containing protein [Armatimonadota bacterium]|nr:STAS domain-containing protein [Armatimonadota bacterium]